ncbi:unnamed protein product, partial [Ixodes pacificus]
KQTKRSFSPLHFPIFVDIFINIFEEQFYHGNGALRCKSFFRVIKIPTLRHVLKLVFQGRHHRDNAYSLTEQREQSKNVEQRTRKPNQARRFVNSCTDPEEECSIHSR